MPKSALAACLKAANPGWGAAELKAAILALARPPAAGEALRLRVGALAAVATAAVRDSSDGVEFCAAAEAETGRAPL